MNKVSGSEATKFLTTDFMPVSTNATVAAAATDGAIVSLRVTSAGSGLRNGTYYAAVYGDGTSAGTASGAIIRITVTGGVISSYGITAGSDTTVHAGGTGYTYANIPLGVGFTFDADATLSTAGTHMGTGGSPAIEAIISPKGGHGSDAPKELGAPYVSINTTFSNTDTQDVTESNDYRRVGLVKNPYAFGTTSASTYFSATTGRTTKALKLTGVSNTFVADDKITQASTNAVGKVVEWDATNKILYYVQTRHNDAGADTNGNVTAFSGVNVITGQTSSATGTPQNTTSTVNNVSFTSGYAAPELQHDSGEILYVENRTKIARATDQTENIKLIIEF